MTSYDADGAIVTNCVVEFDSWPTSGTTITNIGTGGATYNGTANANYYALLSSGATYWDMPERVNYVSVSIPYGPAISNLTNITVETLFYYDGVSGCRLYSKYFHFYTSTNGAAPAYLFIQRGTDTGSYQYTTENILSAGWHFFQLSWNCTSVSNAPVVYLDGVLITLTLNHADGTSWSDDSSQDLVLASPAQYPMHPQSAPVALFRYHNTNLTSGQLATNYNASKWRTTIVNVAAPSVTAMTSINASNAIQNISGASPNVIATTSTTAAKTSFNINVSNVIATTSATTAKTSFNINVPTVIATTSTTISKTSFNINVSKVIATSSNLIIKASIKIFVSNTTASTSINTIISGLGAMAPSALAVTSSIATKTTFNVNSPNVVASTSTLYSTAVPAFDVIVSTTTAVTDTLAATKGDITYDVPCTTAETSVLAAGTTDLVYSPNVSAETSVLVADIISTVPLADAATDVPAVVVSIVVQFYMGFGTAEAEMFVAGVTSFESVDAPLVTAETDILSVETISESIFVSAETSILSAGAVYESYVYASNVTAETAFWDVSVGDSVAAPCVSAVSYAISVPYTALSVAVIVTCVSCLTSDMEASGGWSVPTPKRSIGRITGTFKDIRMETAVVLYPRMTGTMQFKVVQIE